MTANRVTRLADDLANEVSSIIADSEKIKTSVDEYEKQISKQAKEIELIKRIFSELEAKSIQLSASFSSEISRLQEQKEELMDELNISEESLPSKKMPIKTEVEPMNTEFEWKAEFSSPQKFQIELVHTCPVQSVVCSTAFSKNGKLFASSCNKMACLYNVETGNRIFSVFPQSNSFTDENVVLTDKSVDYIRAVALNEDGSLIATGSDLSKIKIWDTKQKKLVWTLNEHNGDIFTLVFFDNSKTIFSGSDDTHVREWDLETGKCVQDYFYEPNPSDGVTSVSISIDGNTIAVGSLDQTIRLWDRRTKKINAKLVGHSNSVYSVAFSPNGKNLVSGSLDQTIRVWDVSTNKTSATLNDHSNFVLSLAFFDEKTFISGSKDKTARFWDLNSNECVAVLYGHQNSVVSVATTCDSYFATGSGDCCAKIWKKSSK